jgi:adenylate cyclase
MRKATEMIVLGLWLDIALARLREPLVSGSFPMTTDKTKRAIAVVHADVKGYSRMMGEDDEYTVRTLASNRQEMSRMVEIHEGQVRDTAGDGFLLEFPSVVDAVKFSVEFQREMKKRNADIPEAKKMEFRIGVNIGT